VSRRVVVAPDSFKGTIQAADAAAALASGWASARPGDELVSRPMADGGEGTIEAFAAAVAGARRSAATVQGPDDRAVETEWLSLPDGTAVIELARTSGLTLLDPLRPLDAHTVGFGQAIAAALDAGAARILLGLGGSSSTDGGLGALLALGAVATDAAGRPIPLGNRGLGTIARLDLSGLRSLPYGGVRILGDVTSPLLGPDGAAAVFGPQKGAGASQVAAMEANLERFARLVMRARPDRGAVVRSDAPGAGAAGGAGFGMLAWGATMSSGAAAVAEAIELDVALAGASLAITGEGRFDGQSSAGKVPSEVARLADAANVPVVLVAGAVEAGTEEFAATVSLTELAGSSAAAMADPARWLRAAGAELAGRWAGDG
jgi:glycerate 2-kinase